MASTLDCSVCTPVESSTDYRRRFKTSCGVLCAKCMREMNAEVYAKITAPKPLRRFWFTKQGQCVWEWEAEANDHCDLA